MIEFVNCKIIILNCEDALLLNIIDTTNSQPIPMDSTEKPTNDQTTEPNNSTIFPDDTEDSDSEPSLSSLEQDAEMFVLQQANLFPDPSGYPDHLPPELNTDGLPDENEDWLSEDLRETLVAIRQVSGEIKDLYKETDKFFQRRASILCYKKYKEEVLKRLLKATLAKTKAIQQSKKAKKRNHPYQSTSTANGTDQTNMQPKRRIVSTTNSPSATVTSSDSLADNPGESLPTVSSSSVGIVTRSPLPPTDKAAEPIKYIQKKSLATQVCSFMPNIYSQGPESGEEESMNHGQSSSSAAVGQPPADFVYPSTSGLTDGQSSGNETSNSHSVADRFNYRSTNGNSSAGRRTNGRPRLMVDPPPTTLPASSSAFGSTSEANPEWPLEIEVEDTDESEEELFANTP